MRQKILVALLLLSITTACSHETILPAAQGAAEKMYHQYASRSGLTVAVVSGYPSAGDTVNAVMLQAHDWSAWNDLLREFGLPYQPDSTVKTSSAMVANFHLDTADGILDSRFDSLLRAMMQERGLSDSNIVFGHRQEWVNGQKVLDSTVRGRNLPDSSIVIRRRQEWVNGQKVFDSSFITDGVPSLVNNHLAQVTLDHGQTGYLIHTESDDLTLWLFFYGNKNQYNSILSRIR